MKASPYFTLMTDEYTDMAILKQLVMVAHYVLPTGEAETNYMHIVDIPYGTATTKILIPEALAAMALT